MANSAGWPFRNWGLNGQFPFHPSPKPFQRRDSQVRRSEPSDKPGGSAPPYDPQQAYASLYLQAGLGHAAVAFVGDVIAQRVEGRFGTKIRDPHEKEEAVLKVVLGGELAGRWANWRARGVAEKRQKRREEKEKEQLETGESDGGEDEGSGGTPVKPPLADVGRHGGPSVSDASRHGGPSSSDVSRHRGPSSNDISELGSGFDDVSRLGATSDNVSKLGPTSDDVSKLGPTSDDVSKLGPTSDDVSKLGPTSDDVSKLGFSTTDVSNRGKSSDDVNKWGATSDDVSRRGSSVDDVSKGGATSDDVSKLGFNTNNVSYRGESAVDVSKRWPERPGGGPSASGPDEPPGVALGGPDKQGDRGGIRKDEGVLSFVHSAFKGFLNLSPLGGNQNANPGNPSQNKARVSGPSQRHRSGPRHDPDDPPGYSLLRSLRMASFAFFVDHPMTNFWTQAIRYSPRKDKLDTTLIKLVLAEAVLTPARFALLFTWDSLLQRKPKRIGRKLRADFRPAVVRSLQVAAFENAALYGLSKEIGVPEVIIGAVVSLPVSVYINFYQSTITAR